ncbi:cysteine desulfurase family protein [Allorhodopirellula heiligendammensis]|uniref:cysteine desulfurase n=1 Tax=Allorhodopirellula heiligendammensis TaxID=2714739 RepID=A0A5C6BZ03_9BACT|nr:cysteine desulfurase family protein [Allorhodopirellula heiligendammensis]TWU16516.1 Cysteine desulfurase [Allorhodopirellula heiligendammensis]
MIYLDYHATTPCDPRVVEAMLPWLTERFANPHSDSHAAGRQAGEAMAQAIDSIAATIHAPASSLLVTSGATESINLAMRGVLTHPRNRRNHMVVCSTEHPAVLDVAADLQRSGVDVTHVGVHPQGDGDNPLAGTIDLDVLANAITPDTALVNVMLVNNETGVIQPIAEVARIAHAHDALVHCDITQAIGRIPINVSELGIDLVSASAHKFYGPKGIGFLVAGGGERRVRVRPQIVGGGQQQGLRSGTMNPAAIIAMETAIRLAAAAAEPQSEESTRIAGLRDHFWQILNGSIEGLRLNGPPLSEGVWRVPGNLNLHLREIEGETWMAATPGVAFSSGSACSSVNPSASHVLRAMGLSESQARRSVRFGMGRFTTIQEIETAGDELIAAWKRFQLS